MEFKVGDYVRGKSNNYSITNRDMILGEVVESGCRKVQIKILDHKDKIQIGKVYPAFNEKQDFEIVNLTIPQLQSEIDKLGNEVDKQNGLLVSNKQRLSYLKSELKKLQRKRPILDEKEKEYLSAVIKPFRDEVITIAKFKNCSDKEFLFLETEDDYAELPAFKKGTMYKGMELDKEYTLKELGL